MSLIKWEPFDDIDRVFNEFPFPFAKGAGRDLAIDLYEEGNDIIAKMSLPGVDGEKIDVSVEDGYLRMSGSREEERKEKKKNYYSKEITRGSFERMVRLPGSVDTGKVKAEYEDGMLTVTLPKIGETRSNNIKVEVKK
jgi:HSP20 family protein